MWQIAGIAGITGGAPAGAEDIRVGGGRRMEMIFNGYAVCVLLVLGKEKNENLHSGSICDLQWAAMVYSRL